MVGAFHPEPMKNAGRLGSLKAASHVAGARSYSASARQRSFETFLLGCLIAGLLWAPLWLGSNRPVPWGVNAAIFCGLAALYECVRGIAGWRRPVSFRRLLIPVACFAIVMGWIILQWTTATPVALHHPIWLSASETLEFGLAGSISVNRDATAVAFLRLFTSASVFWLAVELCRSASGARLLVAAIAIIGLIYATYGIIVFFAFPKSLIWLEKVAYLDSLTSSFVNRNSYATYAGLGFLSSVALALSAFQAQSYGGDRARKAAAVAAVLVGGAGFWLAVSVIIGAALLLTSSRGGISATLAGLLALLVVYFAQRRGRQSPKLVAGGLTLLIALAVAVSFGELLAARLDAQGFRSDDRLAVYGTIWASIMDRPWLGFGYGTFEHVFPMYRDAGIGVMGTWDRAHNTYIEVMQGLGLPISGFLFLGVGVLVFRALKGALTRRRSVTAPLAASAASITVLTHAFVDFSLQIQAVTLTWMALLGAGVAQSWSQDVDTSS